MKRGMATWYKEHTTDQYRTLAVFIGSAINGDPVIQTGDQFSKPIVCSWAQLSQVLKDDADD